MNTMGNFEEINKIEWQEGLKNVDNVDNTADKVAEKSWPEFTNVFKKALASIGFLPKKNEEQQWSLSTKTKINVEEKEPEVGPEGAPEEKKLPEESPEATD